MIVEMNSNVEKDFNFFCKEEILAYEKLKKVSLRLNRFFGSKVKENENEKFMKDDYMYLFHTRIMDHYSSAYLLLSNGFIVDALTLLRSALEDIFVVTNFHITDGYFEEWLRNKKSFQIRAGFLRGKLKENYIFNSSDNDLFTNVYKSLSNISHPKKESIEKMFEYHPNYPASSKIQLKQKVSLLVISMCVNEGLLCKFSQEIYTTEAEVNEIKEIELLYARVFIDLFDVKIKDFDFG